MQHPDIIIISYHPIYYKHVLSYTQIWSTTAKTEPGHDKGAKYSQENYYYHYYYYYYFYFYFYYYYSIL